MNTLFFFIKVKIFVLMKLIYWQDPEVVQRLALRVELIIHFWSGCACADYNARQSALLLVYHVEALCRNLF